MWIVKQKVEPIQHSIDQTVEIVNDWKIDNFHVYVIVEPRRIHVKRLFQFPDNKQGFVVISDNPAWKQEWLPKEEVIELWELKENSIGCIPSKDA